MTEAQVVPIQQIVENIQKVVARVVYNAQNLLDSVVELQQTSQVRFVEAEELGVTASPPGPDEDEDEEQSSEEDQLELFPGSGEVDSED